MKTSLKHLFESYFCGFLSEKNLKNGLKRLDGRLGFQTQLILSLLLIYCQTFKTASFVLFMKPISPRGTLCHADLNSVDNNFYIKNSITAC